MMVRSIVLASFCMTYLIEKRPVSGFDMNIESLYKIRERFHA